MVRRWRRWSWSAKNSEPLGAAAAPRPPVVGAVDRGGDDRSLFWGVTTHVSGAFVRKPFFGLGFGHRNPPQKTVSMIIPW